MAEQGERIKVTIRLSVEAHRGLERLCTAGGFTMTALFEAMGCDVNEGGPRKLLDRGADLAEAARRIDQDRRRR